jgi:hypothetical protein
VVLLAIGAVILSLVRASSPPLSRAPMGSCLRFDQSGPSYRPADCDQSDASYTLLAVTADPKACIDVPGVTRAYTEDTKTYCIGERDVDPATSVNVVRTGDCVAVKGGEPVRAACGPGTLPTLKVLSDIPKQSGDTAAYLAKVCRDAGATKVHQTYAWGISPNPDSDTGQWDRVLCLGVAT